MAALFSSQNNVEKFKWIKCFKSRYASLATLETFLSGSRFSTLTLDQPGKCSVLLRKFTDSARTE